MFIQGHDPSREIYRDLPVLEKYVQTEDEDAARKSLKEAHAGLVGNVKDMMKKLCAGDNRDWDHLVRLPELTSAVTSQWEEFSAVQRCAMARIKMAEIMKEAMSAGPLFCVLGSLGPQAPVVMTACTVGGLVEAYHDYDKARSAAEWKQACLSTHADDELWQTAVCSSDEYMTAVAEYNSSVTNLVVNLAGAAADLGAVAKGVAALRKSAGKLHPSQMQQVTKDLNGVKSIDEAQAIVNKADEMHIGSAGAAAQQLRKAPINPSDNIDNCVACTVAFIKNVDNQKLPKSDRSFWTADEVQDEFGYVGLTSKMSFEKAVKYVEKSTGQRMVLASPMIVGEKGLDFQLLKPGNYVVIVKYSDEAGHIVPAKIFSDGRRVIWDAQINRSYKSWTNFTKVHGRKTFIYQLK